MAVTQNTYTGNGSTVLYSFTFPYLETTDIKVSVNGTVTTAYTLANATTIQFNTAPANGAAIRIYRQTDDAALAATFYPGSAIRSQDLNENFTQNLYVTQESTNNAATATTTANTALTNSTTAIGTANTALSTANTASSNASAAVATANTASSNASAAVSTANTASSNATTAVNTANAATATANSATSTANTALSTANAATSTANAASAAATNAVNTANAASSAASSAVSTANTASTNASNAVTTANTASSNATTAVNTANSAVATANSAAAAVANAVIYTIVANVAAIPASPSNNTAIEVANSTGIESFTPLAGKPGGFVGNSGLSVRIIYSTSGSTWNWVQYFPNDPEARYLKLAGGTVTGNLAVDGTLTKSGNNVVTTGDTGTVTSAMIADGTIVNADVSASAAIAGTKISPDFGSQNITTTGTSTAASFIPTSSTAPTNGVYLPAANSVAISTGGSGRLFVDASGNVGAGTSSPASRLHVDDGFITTGRYGNLGALILRRANGTAASPTQITSAASIAGVYARGLNELGAYNNVSSVGFGSDGAVTSTSSPGYFVVETTPSNSTSPQERLRITSAGLVGVGTSSPGSTLHCNSGSAADVYVRTSNSAASSGFDVGVSSGGIAYVFNRNNTDLRIGTNGAERIIVAAGGNVGIGTTSPQAPLQVFGSIFCGNVSPSTGGMAAIYNDGNNVSFEAVNASNTAQKRNILLAPYGGNVGIGTTSPVELLHVVGSGTTTIRVATSDTSGAAVGRFRAVYPGGGGGATSAVDLRAGDGYGYLLAENNVPLLFGTNNAERARIDSSGRLLVGTSSARGNYADIPQIQLEGTDNNNSSAQLLRNSNNGGGATLYLGKTRGTSIGGTTVVANGDDIGNIRWVASDGTSLLGAASITASVDGTPGANDMPGRLVFSTTADGASSPTEELRITNDGVIAYNQQAPAAVNTTATLTVANLKTGIITSTTAAAVTMTLPTGTLTEGGFSGAYNNMTFEWSVINTGGTNAVTVQAGTDHTLVGSGTVSANNSGRFATRRTALNTWVTYRLSS